MADTKIAKIVAYEVLDSRGNPTVRAVVTLADGTEGIATVPSGASTGAYEAHELRDKAKRYGGKGVLKAVKSVNTEIRKALIGVDARKQQDVDHIMIALDGTPNKKRLGANAILSVSLATARAAALSTRRPLYEYIRKTYRLPYTKYTLPIPGVNIINGGRHADNNLTCQEFMIMPMHKQFSERVRMASQIFHSLQAILAERGYSTGVGDEGGFAPNLPNNEYALKLIVDAIKQSGWTPGKHVYIGLDVAASEFYKDEKYYFASSKQASSADKMIRTLGEWIKKYPILSIEDPLDEDDWDNWTAFTKAYGKQITVVGDDLFVTNSERVQTGIEKKAANSVLIKLNQIGTLSETIETIQLARKHGMSIFISHRSGETVDTFIADLAVAVNADFIKAGSMSRAERVEKYNRLMEIEREIE
jgi:enolase